MAKPTIIPKALLPGEKWHEERRTGVGGSQAAGILGLSPWASPYNVYAEIVEGYRQPETDEMRNGKLLEPVIKARFEAETGFKVGDELFIRDGEKPWWIGTPDGIIDNEDAGAEWKSASPWAKDDWGEPPHGNVPKHYLIQCVDYMELTDRSRWYLAVFFHRDDFRIYIIERDRELGQMIVNKIEEFWNTYIVPKIAPDMLQAKRLNEYLKDKYPTHTMPARDAVLEDMPALHHLRLSKDLYDFAEARLEVAKGATKMLIGEHAGLKLDEGTVSWKKGKDRRKTDWKGVAEAMSDEQGYTQEMWDDVLEANTTVTPGSRPFLFPKPWKHDPKVKDVKLIMEPEEKKEDDDG